MTRAVLLTLATLLVYGCAPEEAPELTNPEPAYQASFYGRTVVLQGQVLDELSQPVAGVEVTIQERTATSDQNGQFMITGLSRQSSLATMTKQGFFDEARVVNLHAARNLDFVEPPTVQMTRRRPSEIRFFFGGDVSMGRRYLSANPKLDEVPKDEPDAILKPSRIDESSRAVLEPIKTYIDQADFASINLETVVTDQPNTPFDSKPYVFFTLPGSLDALQWWGVDYVGLGNNHIYDYFEQGVVDTMENLRKRDFPFSGAGRNPTEAFIPHRPTIAGQEFAFISASSIDGSQYDHLFIADETKGGGADAWDSDRFGGVIRNARMGGRIPIVNLHTGSEYTEVPTDSARARMQFAVDEGALMTIAHHPHVPQGLELYKDGFIAHSLGNLVFDQNRLETVLGLGLYVDVRDDAVARVQGVPIYLEDYIPRPVGGGVADVFLRRIAWASAAVGTNVGVSQGRLWVETPDTPLNHTTRQVEVDVEIGADGQGFLDLRQLASSDESATKVLGTGLKGHMGRDILVFGDMEDSDVDDQNHETSRWWYSGDGSFPCLHKPNRGTVALCSWRTEDNATPTTIAFRNRIRVLGNPLDQPNKDLTFLGYFGGDDAGQVDVEVRYYAAMGDSEFGTEKVFSMNMTGDRSYRPTWTDLRMPADDPEDTQAPTSRLNNARALRIWVSHQAPEEGAAMFRMDDLAIITWMPETQFQDTFQSTSHHPYDYVRLRGEPGVHRVTVELSRFAP